MGFRTFRYEEDAEPELEKIFSAGLFDALKERIGEVMKNWEPASDEESPTFIAPFEDWYLVFTVSSEDPSMLILADVRQAPRL